MGRQEPTAPPQPPHSARRTARAKLARETLRKTIGGFLSSNNRVRKGIQETQLITTHPAIKPKKDQPTEIALPKIQLAVTDTLTAARDLVNRSGNSERVGILNMGSPLRPGGGFFTGASGQEEFLCLRTTILPALSEGFYRLPDLGVVWTKDVLVFRDAAAKMLSKKERYYVDVATAAMLRYPTEYGDAEKELVREKMKAVMRTFVREGSAKRIVLGAWGCGAYGNPVKEIAEAWKTVLLGGRRGKKEQWVGIEEIVFAITDEQMAAEFKEAFGEGLEVIEGEDAVERRKKSEERERLEADVLELETKIGEMEPEVGSVKNEALRARLDSVLQGLKKDLDDKRILLEELSNMEAEEASGEEEAEEEKSN